MVLSSAIVCDHDRRIADDRRSMFPYDRRRSQTLLRSAICDPRSYGDQPLCSIFCDRLRSSAIMIAGSQTIAEVCFHMIADDRRQSQTLLRSAIRNHMETSLKGSDGHVLLARKSLSASREGTRCTNRSRRVPRGRQFSRALS